MRASAGADPTESGDPDVCRGLREALLAPWPWDAAQAARLVERDAAEAPALLWFSGGDGRGIAAVVPGQEPFVLEAWLTI